MATLKTPSMFISFNEQGRAILAGTTIKIIEVALDHLAHGWSPDEIYYQHYRTLSMAQIHAALSYYYEHQAEFDTEIERQVHEAEALRRAAGESPFVRRLRESGRLP